RSITSVAVPRRRLWDRSRNVYRLSFTYEQASAHKRPRRMLAHLPPFYRIDHKEDGNAVVQLAVPSVSFEATGKPHAKDRVKGSTLTPDTAGPDILVITNSASPPPTFTHVLRFREETPDPTSGDPVDLTAGRWVRHPDLTPPPATTTEYEAHAVATRDTWHG